MIDGTVQQSMELLVNRPIHLVFVTRSLQSFANAGDQQMYIDEVFGFKALSTMAAER